MKYEKSNSFLIGLLLPGCIQIVKSHGIQDSNFPGLESHRIMPRSWKINQMVAAFLTHVRVFGLYVHYHSPLSDSVRSVV